MNEHYADYDWEGLKVETEDGYILTLFHVWKEGEMDPEKGPILFQHGNGGHAAGMIESQNVPGPQFTFVDLGHHVYFGNNRGVEYSREHVDPDIDEETYWNFSWHEMMYDVYANVETMFEYTGK